MKKFILMALLFAPMTMFAQKFGHLDAQAILQGMPEYTKAAADVQAKGTEFEKELTAMRTEIETASANYDKQKSTMNATAQQAEEKKLNDLYQKFQTTNQDYNKQMQDAQQAAMTPITEKLVNAIKAVGAAGGYVYIMDVNSGVPYISTTLSKDVTADVKAELNKVK